MIDGAFVVDNQVRLLAGHLVAVKPSLRVADIEASSSLTEDLGFDSLDLVRLASLIQDTYPRFDLREWLVGAVQSQGDTVGSMATMLAKLGEVPNA